MHEIKSNLPPGMKGFFMWLNRTQPAVHARVVKALARPSLSGLGITAPDATPSVMDSTKPAASTTADKIKDIVLALSQGYLTVQQMNAQKKVLDMQLERAKQGLPPLALDMQQYGLTGPQVSVGVSSDTKSMLGIGAAVLAGVYLLPKFLRRKRG